MKHIILVFFVLAGSSYCFGQQLVYTPKNPAFGGDPFQYTWLLNSANAQNDFQDPLGDFGDFDALNQSLNSQLLGQQFGGQTPEVGTSQNGDLEYDVFETSEGLVINILNIMTGEQSQIIIPN